jgi:XrtJ-associated TM-motif-TM protein
VSKFNAICLGLTLFVCATPLLAQDGCVDSPENPTVVLAIVGSAGALFSTLRFRAKRNR